MLSKRFLKIIFSFWSSAVCFLVPYLSSRSLIQSSASSNLLVPSTMFFISLIVFFNSYWFFLVFSMKVSLSSSTPLNFHQAYCLSFWSFFLLLEHISISVTFCVVFLWIRQNTNFKDGLVFHHPLYRLDCTWFFLAVVGCRSWGFPGNGHHIRKAKTEVSAGYGALEF